MSVSRKRRKSQARSPRPSGTYPEVTGTIKEALANGWVTLDQDLSKLGPNDELTFHFTPAAEAILQKSYLPTWLKNEL